MTARIMIPYFQFTTIHIGPIPIQVWGLMVAFGILAGTFAAGKMAEHRGQDTKLIWDLSFWVIVGAFLFAKLFMVFYDPTTIFATSGFSIIGGFIGATLFGIIYLRKKHVDVYAYADTAIFGLPLGLFIGRIGCFLIHDHPGTLSDSILAVKFPDGARLDHGLLLSINGLLMFLVFLWLAKKKARTGTYLIVFLVWYGIVRFFLDFLRATDGPIVDARYFSLTPAQYAAVGMMIGGVVIARRLSKKN